MPKELIFLTAVISRRQLLETKELFSDFPDVNCALDVLIIDSNFRVKDSRPEIDHIITEHEYNDSLFLLLCNN